MNFKDLIHNGVAVIPYGVTEIGADAFFLCGDLTSIEIPNSVTKSKRLRVDVADA